MVLLAQLVGQKNVGLLTHVLVNYPVAERSPKGDRIETTGKMAEILLEKRHHSRWLPQYIPLNAGHPATGSLSKAII